MILPDPNIEVRKQNWHSVKTHILIIQISRSYPLVYALFFIKGWYLYFNINLTVDRNEMYSELRHVFSQNLLIFS